MKKLLLLIGIVSVFASCEKEEALLITPEKDTISIVNNYYDTIVENDTISVELLDSIYFTDTIYIVDTIIEPREDTIEIQIEETFLYYIITRTVAINVYTGTDIIYVNDFDTLGFNSIEEFIIRDSFTNTIYDTLTVEDFEYVNFKIYDI